ncbi:flagellar hook-basal body protein [Jeotgalibaca ciconiae]|uniref:Flagellar hook-basal body complex protein n=1 Tax=Jeotgalibaca ciconiae TaxID=2496265 RepID=A0A3Q9BK93_9LACT|nr:flagellar hook-basal body complex protein [Jeotgalibaca ciconiae]AZP04289.1 flagellar hook-basal body complex protein [Jeotgalibaca ciconiae]
MNPALGISRTGMHAFQNAMDTISYDIANVNTTAYKGRQSEFETLLTNATTTPEDLTIEISSGSRNEVSALNMQQGSLTASEGEFQLAIVEGGFFQVTGADGEAYYTRDGNFLVNPNGIVVNAHGEALTIAANAVPTDTPVYLINPEQLIAVGENKFVLADGATAVQDNNATVLQGYLENSNVDLATRFTDMMVVQRAYAMNVKAAQSADEMMSMINQFKQ